MLTLNGSTADWQGQQNGSNLCEKAIICGVTAMSGNTFMNDLSSGNLEIHS